MRIFNGGYFAAAAVLFVVEILIALFFKGGFVRLYVGDYLVVILIYCAVKTFANVSGPKAAAGVLVFSFAVEISQYFQLIHRLGLESSTLAQLILGSLFEWKDLLAYTGGVGTILIVEGARLWATPGRSLLLPLKPSG